MRTYRRRPRLGPLAEPEDLHDYAATRATRRRGLRLADLDGWVVADTWPERIPVTEAEVDLFERHFGDVLDALFGKIER
jgi:hypothetical protein